MKITVTCGKTSATLASGLQRFVGKLAHVHRVLGQAYLELVQAGFAAERSPTGVPWKELAPATVKKRGSSHPILNVHGYLARVNVQHDEHAAVVGSNLVYAPIHQFGGVIQRKGGSVKLHFKKFKRGPRKGKVRFSTEKQASYSKTASVAPYSIRIPARPWLFSPDGSVPEAWKQKLLASLKKMVDEDYAKSY